MTGSKPPPPSNTRNRFTVLFPKKRNVILALSGSFPLERNCLTWELSNSSHTSMEARKER